MSLKRTHSELLVLHFLRLCRLEATLEYLMFGSSHISPFVNIPKRGLFSKYFKMELIGIGDKVLPRRGLINTHDTADELSFRDVVRASQRPLFVDFGQCLS